MLLISRIKFHLLSYEEVFFYYNGYVVVNQFIEIRMRMYYES